MLLLKISDIPDIYTKLGGEALKKASILKVEEDGSVKKVHAVYGQRESEW
jgi:hypothetical protein